MVRTSSLVLSNRSHHPRPVASFRRIARAGSLAILGLLLTWSGSASGQEVAVSQKPASEVAAVVPNNIAGPGQVSVAMRTGGIGRYVPNRWSMVTGKITNASPNLAPSLIVVTPLGSEGLQFARRVDVPPGLSFETAWPVLVHKLSPQGLVEFQYLHFPSGEDDGLIRLGKNEREIPSFSGLSQKDARPLCGIMIDSTPDPVDGSATQAMIATMHFVSEGNIRVVSINARDLRAGTECLDGLDQLAITDPELQKYPEACECIRMWVQRGGRLLLAMEGTGSEVAEAILGDCLPFTVVGETTTNAVTLELNPEYTKNQYPVRSVDREFPEPIRYLRVQPGAGEVIWTVDGWPVAMRADMGRGTVLVTSISSDVFIQTTEWHGEGSPSHELIASTRRMHEALFSKRNPPLIPERAAAASAAELIGYEIPSRSVAFWLLLILPVGLLVGGVALQRKSLGERLIFVVPVLSLLAAAPAAWIGFQIRSVAPMTVIETAVVQSSPGMTNAVEEGFATAFLPSPAELKVSSNTGAVVDVLQDSTISDYRRLIWRSASEVSWVNLKQPAGLRTYKTRAIVRRQQPLRAIATFDEKGLRGQLQADGQIPSVALLAGVNRENLAVRLDESGEFRCEASDSLARGQFFRTSLLSDDQLFQSELMRHVFVLPAKDRTEAFPSVPSLVYWDTSESKQLQFEDSTVRRQRSVLTVQPLELTPPDVGVPITIPPQLLSYRSAATVTGGFSSIFNNLKREWIPFESAAETLLEFQIPPVCLPFDVESAELELLIRAGSREVKVFSGPYENLQQVSLLQSPLGTQSITLPIDLIKSECRNGKVFVQFNISDLGDSMKASELSGEQDDSWQIERVLLSLKGRRSP